MAISEPVTTKPCWEGHWSCDRPHCVFFECAWDEGCAAVDDKGYFEKSKCACYHCDGTLD
mgnify:CR=1 FL=1